MAHNPHPPEIDRWTPTKSSHRRSARNFDSYTPSSLYRPSSPYKRSSRRDRSRCRSPCRSSRRDRSKSPLTRHRSHSSVRRWSPSPRHRSRSHHSRHRSTSRTTLSSISVSSSVDIEESPSDAATRHERSDRLPGPPIFAIVSNPSRIMGIKRCNQFPIVASKVVLPEAPSATPSTVRPASATPSVTQLRSLVASIPTARPFTMVGNYAVPAPKPEVQPLPSRLLAIAGTRKTRPCISAHLNIRRRFVGLGGSYIRQLQDKYDVNLTNKRVHHNLIEICIHAKSPITKESEEKADFVHAGIKLWISQTESAAKAGAAFYPPQSIVQFLQCLEEKYSVESCGRPKYRSTCDVTVD